MKLKGNIRLKDVDKGFKALKQLSTLGAAVNVGLSAAFGEDVLVYGRAQEFGTDTISARSFMRSTLDKNNAKYKQILKGIAVQTLNSAPQGKLTNPVGQLEQLGRHAVADIRAKIKSDIPPPLADATVARKARLNQPSTALIATGKLLKSVEFEITGLEKKGGHHGG